MPRKPKSESIVEIPVVDLPANPTPIASLDLANSSVKIAAPGFEGEFRSIVGRLSKSRHFGKVNHDLVIKFEGKNLVFGDEAYDHCEGTPQAFTDWERYQDEFYRELFAAALWKTFGADYAGKGMIEPKIVISIPATEYRVGHSDAVKEKLLVDDGHYLIEGQSKETLQVSIHADRLKVIPEGAGAYFEALQKFPEIAGMRISILDVGYYTANHLQFNKGNYIGEVAKSCTHGVQVVAQAVLDYLIGEMGYDGDIHAVDMALPNGAIDLDEKRRCVSFVERRNESLNGLYDQIYKWFRSVKGQRSPQRVFFAGGGGALLSEIETAKQHGWQSLGRRANADGGLRIAESM